MRPTEKKGKLMEQRFAQAKEFVKKHRVAVAIVSTASVCLTLNRYALKQHDDFLKEKGLYNEYYYLDE
jgi:hypothetical protein